MFAVLIESLGNGFAAYRIFQDAGVWMLQLDAPYIQNFLQSFMTERGLL